MVILFMGSLSSSISMQAGTPEENLKVFSSILKAGVAVTAIAGIAMVAGGVTAIKNCIKLYNQEEDPGNTHKKHAVLAGITALIAGYFTYEGAQIIAGNPIAIAYMRSYLNPIAQAI